MYVLPTSFEKGSHHKFDITLELCVSTAEIIRRSPKTEAYHTKHLSYLYLDCLELLFTDKTTLELRINGLIRFSLVRQRIEVYM